MPLEIDAAYEGGNIEIVKVDGDVVELAIRPDAGGRWYQWFDFRVSGAAGRDLVLRIVNAGGSAYPDGWPGYAARVSATEDDDDWLLAETTYEGGVLEIRHTPRADRVRFAYFAPYDLARHRALLDRAAAAPGVVVQTLGRTFDDRPLESITLGEGPIQLWIVARQHSGETMASWWMEGAIDRLLTPNDPITAALRSRASLHLVPIVNLDGAARGHLRGSASGLDLNRQWHEPDPAQAPEIAAILSAMDQTGVALSLDVHGDETLRHNFVDGCDSDPASSPRQVAGVEAFKQALLAASPAFQTKVGYAPTYGGSEGGGMATRAIARRYGAVGLTLEMPFGDSLEASDARHGWSPAASRQMGRDCLSALAAILDELA